MLTDTSIPYMTAPVLVHSLRLNQQSAFIYISELLQIELQAQFCSRNWNRLESLFVSKSNSDTVVVFVDVGCQLQCDLTYMKQFQMDCTHSMSLMSLFCHSFLLCFCPGPCHISYITHSTESMWSYLMRKTKHITKCA